MLCIVRTIVFFFGLFFIPSITQASELSFFSEIYPPLSFYDKSQLTGASVSVVNAISKKLYGKSTTIKVRPWGHAFKLVRDYDNKVLLSVARTSNREKTFKWVGPLFESPRHLYVARSRLKHIEQRPVRDLKISVTRHGAEYELLSLKGFNRLDTKLFAKGHLKRVAHGRSDAWVSNELSFKYRSEQLDVSPDTFTAIYPLGQETLYLAFSNTTPDSIINTWQSTLDAMKVSGEFNQLTDIFING